MACAASGPLYGDGPDAVVAVALFVVAGPPWETSQIWLNTLKSQITDGIVMTIRLGLIGGTVIC